MKPSTIVFLLGIYIVFGRGAAASPVLAKGPGTTAAALMQATLKQQVHCKESDLLVIQDAAGLRVTGVTNGARIDMDLSSGPLGHLQLNQNMFGRTSVGCHTSGFTLQFKGVRFGRPEHLELAFEHFTYDTGRGFRYHSQAGVGFSNEPPEEKLVVSSLDPLLPIRSQSELTTQCPRGRYHLIIDDTSKTLLAHSEAGQTYGVDLTNSRLAKLIFDRNTWGGMRLSCDKSRGAIVVFKGASDLSDNDDEEKLEAVQFRAKLTEKATLVEEAPSL